MAASLHPSNTLSKGYRYKEIEIEIGDGDGRARLKSRSRSREQKRERFLRSSLSANHERRAAEPSSGLRRKGSLSGKAGAFRFRQGEWRKLGSIRGFFHTTLLFAASAAFVLAMAAGVFR